MIHASSIHYFQIVEITIKAIYSSSNNINDLISLEYNHCSKLNESLLYHMASQLDQVVGKLRKSLGGLVSRDNLL